MELTDDSLNKYAHIVLCTHALAPRTAHSGRLYCTYSRTRKEEDNAYITYINTGVAVDKLALSRSLRCALL